MIGKVTEWKMTEEERQAYIEKNPIRPSEKAKKHSSTISHIDFKWRGKKAAASHKAKKA